MWPRRYLRTPTRCNFSTHETFDAALLDVNLDGAMLWDVAVVLQERGIPFVFATGYDVSSVLPDPLTGSPVIGKPCQLSELQQVIERVIVATKGALCAPPN